MRVSLHWQESKACAVTGTCVKLGKIKPKKLKEGVVGVQGGSKERSPAGTPHDHRLVLSSIYYHRRQAPHSTAACCSCSVHICVHVLVAGSLAQCS